MPDASQLATYAKLLRLEPVDAVDLATPAVATASVPTVWRRPRGLWAFLLMVVLPTVLAGSYLWLFAANRYESEARFVLRLPGRSMQSAAVADLLQSAGAGRSNDDGYVVREFLESRDAMAILDKQGNLRRALGVAKHDPIWGYPSFFRAENNERLYDHYGRMMSATFDSTTGVSSLKFEAFTPQDAQTLTATLLGAAETLVNRLNERARQDALSIATAEVGAMRQRVVAAQTALTAFREREKLVDPSQATLAVVEAISRLSVDAADLSVQINQITKGSPQSPQIATLRNRRAAIETQINIERKRLAGDSLSIAPRIAEYERLMLEREFSERALMAAMSSVENARIEAQRQQVYLERVAEPSRPDYPAYPLRLVWTLVVAAAGGMAFGMWRILSEDARRHAEP
jgi:capsular polysaccharide transport system permease protein